MFRCCLVVVWSVLLAWGAWGCQGDPNGSDGGPNTGCTPGSCPEGQFCDSKLGCRARCNSDKDCQAKVEVCHRTSGRCVICARDEDCKTKQVCRRFQCFDDITCKSSKTCPGEQLCNIEEQRCVDCLTETDCSDNRACEDGVCVPIPPACTSTKDCKSLGLVCWSQRSRCVDCLSNNDCSSPQMCIANVCKVVRLPSSCSPGKAVCAGTQLKVCNGNGNGWTDKPCPEGQTCFEGSCKTTVCTPGTSECAGSVGIRTCQADGQGWTTIECPTGQSCFTDRCVEQACKPGERRCKDTDTAQECDPTGLKWNSNACSDNQSCQEGECKVVPCTDGANRACYTGEPSTKGVGICREGTQTCKNGVWGACTGEIKPAGEACGNQQDDNCDGNIDEGCD